MERRIQVEVELTNGERRALTSKFNKLVDMEQDLKNFFNISIDKEILSIVLDEVKKSILESNLTIGNLKSIHFSICETQENKIL